MARTTTSRLAALALAAAAAATALAGCGPDEPGCVEDLDLECQPLVDPPTFDAIYDNTLHPTCASGDGTCHSSDGHKAGLVFEDPDEAYDLLLGAGGGEARVLPGDPSCSLIVKRVESDRSSYRMPPGSDPLPAAERCMIEQWIAQGAER